jgi:hypothetical protein
MGEEKAEWGGGEGRRRKEEVYMCKCTGVVIEADLVKRSGEREEGGEGGRENRKVKRGGNERRRKRRGLVSATILIGKCNGRESVEKKVWRGGGVVGRDVDVEGIRRRKGGGSGRRVEKIERVGE